MLVTVLACACPSFADLEVDDPTGTAEARIEAAIADFAAWSGRAGVCVGEIEVVEDAWPGWPEAKASHRDRRILVEADTWAMERTIRHELCHGLDQMEAITLDHPHLFAADDADVALYGREALARQEAFAAVCEQPAPDLGAARAVDETCGTTRVTRRRDWVAKHVWTAVGETEVGTGEEPETTPVSRVLDGLEWPTPVGSAGDTIVSAGWIESGTRVTVREDDGTVVSTWDAELSTPVVAASDRDPVLLAGGGVYVFDADKRFFTLEDAPDRFESAVVSEGVIYARVWRDDAWGEGTGAWTLDGELLDWEAPPRTRALAPIAGGVAALTWTSVATYDRASDTWTESAAPSGMEGLFRVGEGWITTWGRGWVVEDGGWSLAGDPCDEPWAWWVPTTNGGVVLDASGSGVRLR